MITVRLIDREHKEDINIKNEPFKLFGRMIPSYTGKKWSYEIERFPEAEITEMCFPDGNYDYDELAKNHILVGAYDGDKCIGLALVVFEKNADGNAFWEKQGFTVRSDLTYRDKMLVEMIRIDT